MRSDQIFDPTSDEHVLQLARMLETYWDSRIEHAVQVVVNTIVRGAMEQAMTAKAEDLGYIQGMRQGALGVLAHLERIRTTVTEKAQVPEAAAERYARQMAFGGGTLSSEHWEGD